VTQESPERPPVRRVRLGVGHGDEQVVAHRAVVVEQPEHDAAAWMIRATVERLERHGEIYNASGDATDPRWKVTHT